MTQTRALGLRDVLARLPKARAALDYAEKQHKGQRRNSDGAPFIEHPLEVGWLLYRAGAPEHVVAAGLLHDLLEKTSASESELRRRFGSATASLVTAVSEDQTIGDYRERKALLRRQVAAAGPEALLVFAADKVSKVRELRAAIFTASRRHERPDESLLPPRRLVHLRNCLGMLEERLADSPLVTLLGTELAELDHDLKTLTATGAIA